MSVNELPIDHSEAFPNLVKAPIVEAVLHNADIVGFPATKEDQLSLAEKLAANATDRQAPPDSE